jgi:hypothetical protein
MRLSYRPSRGRRTSPRPARSPSPEWSDEGVLRWEGDTGYVSDALLSDNDGGRNVSPAAAVRPTPNSKDKGRAPSPMPDYESMTTKQLQVSQEVLQRAPRHR